MVVVVVVVVVRVVGDIAVRLWARGPRCRR